MSPHPSPKPAGTGWGLVVVLLAVLGGGGLLACGLVCVGVGSFLASAKMAKDRATAKVPEVVQEQPKERPGRPETVGFRKMTLAYQPKDGPARQRRLLLWYPASGEDRPFNYNGQQGFATLNAPVSPGVHPVVLFSHGFLGAADQTIFLMEALARDGYIVAAVDHADASSQKGAKIAWPDFADAKTWDEDKYRDRRDDLVALLDHLLELDGKEDSFLHRHVDRDRIGAAGHSLGGYTVLGMLGGWESWREPRIRAALLLSPYALPYLRKPGLRTIQTPVMLQDGTLDLGITPFLNDVYRPLDGAKYYLVLKNESHFGWTNLISLGKTTRDCIRQGNAKLMTDYSLAFFAEHLRGEASPLLQTRAEGLDSYQFKPAPPR